MKLCKYKCPNNIYNSFISNFENKKSIKIFKFLKTDSEFSYFDIVWNQDELEVLADYKIWKPFNQFITHGEIIENEYVKSWCETGVDHPICGGINFVVEQSNIKKQMLIENGVDYYGY